MLISYSSIENMELSVAQKNLQEFLKLALAKCMDMFKAHRGSIFLWDEQGKELILEIARNGKENSFIGVRQKLGEGIAGKVALKREPMLVEDVDVDPRLKDRIKYRDYESKSFLSVPLEFCGQLVGIINIADKEDHQPFTYSDLNLLISISNYLAISIYSLRRYLKSQEELKKEVDKEVEELKNKLEVSKKFSSLGKLAGGIVHELNNPLDGVIRYTNLALDALEESSVAREYLLEAKKGLTRIAELLRSLLDFSWSLSSSARPADINKTIEEAIFMMGHYLVSRNIEVHTEYSQKLPLIPDYRLKLLFTNLIKNAYEAIDSRGGKITISTGIEDGFIKIKVSDTGRGVPSEIKDRIFEPFFTTKSIGEGMGLGLAICYEIVQRYGGNISLESKISEGTSFIICIPLENKVERNPS